MPVEIRIPSVGESVKEAVLVQWYKNDGDRIQKDDPLFLIETDKITLEVVAETDGILKISVTEGQTVAIGSVVGYLEPEAESEAPKARLASSKKETQFPVQTAAIEKLEEHREALPSEPAPAAAKKTTFKPTSASAAPEEKSTILSPAVRQLVAEHNISVSKINATGPGGRITKGDILLYLEQEIRGGSEKLAAVPASQQPKALVSRPSSEPPSPDQEKISRKPMSPIRRRIAARLLEAKQNTAMLTTFNEIDMSRVMEIRGQLKEKFQKKHGVSLGLMSFFIKATVAALEEFPEINASIEEQDIIYHYYYHIGIAIGSDRGLVVPVIRHADRLSFAELERNILEFVKKIKENRLNLADLEGGTFTISNGGVYGSLLSTPILNMPQSGILGMHKIENRPVAIDGKVVIHPMMYVALSYDHRIVDGREAVTFLKRIKECIEKPEEIMMET